MPTTKLVAAGLGGLLLLGVVGWAAMGQRPSVVPVIEADGRPLRVKPDNPGGMQVAGADETGTTDGPGSNRMAPTAETPAPQALRAQMQQATPAADLDRSGASPLPDTPARPGGNLPGGILPGGSAPIVPTPVATAPIPAPTPAAGSAILVQLGALPTEAAAHGEWTKLSRSVPALVGSRQPSIEKIERNGRIFWRLRTGGFTDMADATGFCAKVHAKGGGCAIASF